MGRLQLSSAGPAARPAGQSFVDAIAGGARDAEGSGDGPDNGLTDKDSEGAAAGARGPSSEGSSAQGGNDRSGTEGSSGGLDDQELASVQVAFGNVRAPSTPTGVGDRIPPNVDFPISVTLTGWHPPMAPVRISVQGAGGGHGDATIDGAATQEITASGTIQLRGTVQTDPGNAGSLRLAASLGSSTIGRSNAFTVCAIPQNFNIAFQSLITGSRRGIRVQNQHQSDSGTVGDLDQVQISEVVQYGAGTGTFAGVTSGHNSGYRSGTAFPTDSHGTPVSLITGAGHIEAQQAFKFQDARSGAVDIPVKNSGYLITRDVTDDGAGNREITTSKAGAATSPHGNASNAGSGSVSRPQSV